MKIRSLDNPSILLSVISDDQGDIYLTIQDTEKDPFGQTVRIGGPASGHQLPNRIHRLLYALASEFKRFEKIRFESDAAQMEDLEERQLKENSSFKEKGLDALIEFAKNSPLCQELKKAEEHLPTTKLNENDIPVETYEKEK